MQRNVVINQRKYVAAPTDTEVITAGWDKGGLGKDGVGGEEGKKGHADGWEVSLFICLFILPREKRDVVAHPVPCAL